MNDVLLLMKQSYKYPGLQTLARELLVIFFSTTEHFSDTWASWSIFRLDGDQFLARRIYYLKNKVYAEPELNGPNTIGHDCYIDKGLAKQISTSFPKNMLKSTEEIMIDGFSRYTIIPQENIDYEWLAHGTNNYLYDKWLEKWANVLDDLMPVYSRPYIKCR